MANAVGFEGANDKLLAPKGDESCRDLEMFRTESGVMSCWRLTEEELKRVIAGRTHPPVFISGTDVLTIDGKPVKAEPYIEPAMLGGKIK